jgi:hypothetical protein
MDSISSFVRRHADALAIAIVVISALTTLLFFNARMNEGGDDSMYICRAYDFIDICKYPNFQGPLYPIFLSVFIRMGFGIFALKMTSVILLALSQGLFYLSLRRHTPAWVLLSTMLLLALNPWFLEFGSLTYSEALFMVVQWGAVWLAMRYDSLASSTSSPSTSSPDIKRTILLGLGLAALLVTLFLVRTVGFALAVAVIAFLLLRRHWRHVAILVGGIVVVFGLWVGIRTAVWGPDVKTGGQMETLLQKDPYDKSEGLEDFSGFCERAIGNSDLYLSKHLTKMLGFLDKDSRTKSRPLSILYIALLLTGCFFAWRRSRDAGPGMLMLGLSGLALVGVTFVSLQVMWDQYRLVVPFLPMIYAVLLFGVYHLARLALKDRAKVVMAILVGLLVCTSCRQVGAKMDILTTRKNLKSDDLFGYTPDYYHYAQMCRYIGENEQLNKPDVYVACRKPEMARIYAGGKKFYGMYTIPSTDPDTLVQTLRGRGVTHVIIASLRRDPADPHGGVINTVHRYMAFILQKYPDFIRGIHAYGNENDEPAILYEIKYPENSALETSANN